MSAECKSMFWREKAPPPPADLSGVDDETLDSWRASYAETIVAIETQLSMDNEDRVEGRGGRPAGWRAQAKAAYGATRLHKARVAAEQRRRRDVKLARSGRQSLLKADALRKSLALFAASVVGWDGAPAHVRRAAEDLYLESGG